MTNLSEITVKINAFTTTHKNDKAARAYIREQGLSIKAFTKVSLALWVFSTKLSAVNPSYQLTPDEYSKYLAWTAAPRPSDITCHHIMAEILGIHAELPFKISIVTSNGNASGRNEITVTLK